MKKTKFLSFLLCLIAVFVLTIISASAKTSDNKIYYLGNAENSDTAVYPQQVGSKTYLFLPAAADLSSITFRTDKQYTSLTISADKSTTITFGNEVDILSLFDEPDKQNGEYTVSITATAANEDTYWAELTIMKSENIKALFLISENPENEGRNWVDKSKSNEAKGRMVYVNADGTIYHSDEVTELKARGNSTFTDFEKKAYQIKIKNKTNLTGDKDNAQKKWVLLANAGDITLIHNSLVATLAKDLGLPYTIDCEPIDLYYDGEYRGSYLITDKVEVGDTGVDIQDLDGLIEDANEDNDAYENPVVVTKTFASKGEVSAKTDSNGSYKYVEGLIEPELEEGTTHHGYLLELDFIYRYPNEQSGFVTNRGQAVVTKNPEYLTKETGAFISQFFQDFEDAVFSDDGYNAKTGKYYYEYCDLDSLVKIYLINEYTKNYDSYRSSTYFYLPEDEDIMYAGPIWDYDLCFTTGYDYNSQIAGNYENFWAATKYLSSKLITIESFRDAVKEYLNSEDGEFYLAAKKMLGDDGSIAEYSANIYASQRMNFKMWDITHDETAAFRCGDEETYENGVDFLYDFATNRLEWLANITSTWEGDNYTAPMDPTKWSSTYRYHEPVVINAKNPTCTEYGNTEGIVCQCGEMVFKKSTMLPATGHSWKITCNKPKICTVCGETDTSADIPGHDWADATCIAPKTCTICEAIHEDTSLGDHVWTEATCNTPKTCKFCKLTEDDDIFGNHDWQKATCITLKTCKFCGITDEETPFADHNWNAATCTQYSTCTVCGTVNENSQLAEHLWIDATCTSPKLCTVCEITSGEPISHEYKLDPDNSKNSETLIVYKCGNCNTEIYIKVQPTPENLKGDLNMDGKITAADARTALRIAAMLDTAPDNILAISDMNDDKKITAADARLILRKAAKLTD